MSAERLEAILAQQMPDADKRRRADVVIDTSRGFDAARVEVRALVEGLSGEGLRSTAPPSGLPAISPSRGEIGSF